MVALASWAGAICLLAAVTLFVAASSNDDFGFDVSEDLELEISDKDAPEEGKLLPPRKLKGIPDVTAVVGKLLKFTVPTDAFAGNVEQLELKSPLPPWLTYSPSARTFRGVPLSTDKSDVLISMVAQGGPTQNSVFDVFRIHVQQYPGKAQYISEIPCSKNPLVLTIFIDKKLSAVKPQQRNDAIHNLAGFLGINISAFTLEAQKAYSDTMDSTVLSGGPGNVKKRTSKQTSSIDLLVGCESKLWSKFAPLLQQLKEQARDGTLAEVIGLPVLGWRVRTELGSLERGRRETPEEEYDEYYDYEYDGDEDDDDVDLTTLPPPHFVTEETFIMSTTTATQSEIEAHHHRHHHGEVPVGHVETVEEKFSTSTVPPPTIYVSTPQENESSTARQEPDYYTNNEDDEDYESETEVPVPVTEPPTSKTTFAASSTTFQAPAISTEEDVVENTTTEKVTIPVRMYDVLLSFPTTEETTVTTTESTVTTVAVTTPTSTSTTSTTTMAPPTSPPAPITTTEATTTSTTSTTTTTTTTTARPSTTTEEVMSTNLSTLSDKQITIQSTSTSSRTTEFIDYGPKNYPPTINQRLKRIRITAGTVLSYFIPEDTFTDLEDGTNLVLKFLDAEGAPVKNNFWIQFNERTREIYGLPLEEHVSKWEFIVQATDKDGATVSDTLEVAVQQHKGRRTVTHEFELHIRIEKKHEFPTAVDWQLRTLRGLASLFHNKDLNQIVVRQINSSTEFVTFTWTNDTLPRSYCPKNELDHLLNVMVANSEGDPSFALSQVLAPELRVKQVKYKGIGQCEEKPELPPPKASPTNFSPIPRNQVDQITATVGELLIFKVPDDTFYDPEDGNARNLKMSLLTIDHQPIPADHWLQFDVKNQEFFGIPLAADVGRSEYQLVCEDRGGLTANDGLVVVVNVPPRIHFNVEFSMALDMSHDTFINSASIKRKFMEKLAELFRDKDTTNIRIINISEGTAVSWSNKSLAVDRCPEAEIKRLREVLVNDDETLADRVEVIMGPEFPVAAITLTPIGICQSELNVVNSPEIVTIMDEASPTETSDEYLITFIVPAVIIAAMLLLAGVVACVLYRRRRTGKMNVETEEHLNNFRSKGIPVIFQDEIDEKPESGTKAPVILKEEKPPLAPPEYSKSGTPQLEDDNDAPYQPPPPFTSNQDNGRQPRPKPTPTYRKPPPYVPP